MASKGAALALLARIAAASLAAWTDAATASGAGGRTFLVPALAFFAALTATFGNLAAYLQTNLKRLLPTRPSPTPAT